MDLKELRLRRLEALRKWEERQAQFAQEVGGRVGMFEIVLTNLYLIIFNQSTFVQFFITASHVFSD